MLILKVDGMSCDMVYLSFCVHSENEIYTLCQFKTLSYKLPAKVTLHRLF